MEWVLIHFESKSKIHRHFWFSIIDPNHNLHVNLIILKTSLLCCQDFKNCNIFINKKLVGNYMWKTHCDCSIISYSIFGNYWRYCNNVYFCSSFSRDLVPSSRPLSKWHSVVPCTFSINNATVIDPKSSFVISTLRIWTQ